jgi:5-methyltetrahydropteroyltriglutamate--homocysteine methyltransferase
MSDAISTTHTGSLPRPDAVLRMLANREAGLEVDAAASEAQLAAAVDQCVDHQIDAASDIVNDGELSKPGYSTYVKDRLSGFGGEGKFPMPVDLAEYPGFAKRIFGDQALAALKTPACIGPIAYRDLRPVEQDIKRLQRALRGRRQGFMTAASPGVISVFLQNKFYSSHEAYLQALAEAMRVEYQAIHAAGLILQLDCPDLAMSAHCDHAGLTNRELRRELALHVEALNYAVAGIPADRMRIHLCWGNYEGPHHRDVELVEIVDLVLAARPSGISFVAANPRHEHEWKIWQEIRIPGDKVLIPGVVDSTTNFIEHPSLVADRLVRFARIVGQDRVIAGTDCGFSTFAGLHVVDPAITWAKLATLSEGARLAAAVLRHGAWQRPVITQPHP